MSLPLDWIDGELADLEEAQLLRRRVSRSGKMSSKIVVDGQRYLNFGSNDYLGVAGDPSLQDVVEKTVLRGGWGSGASPLIVGRSSLHAELERRLATFLGCESALLFPTGYSANTGTIPALVGKGDVVFSDANNHASLIDGCRLSRAKIVVYSHRDVTALAELLSRESTVGKKLVVTDGLFSMDGDVAPIEKLASLAEEHHAMLLVDEAHALGVLGDDGRGVSAHLGNAVSARVGTLSKALGSHGGFVAGSQRLIDYLSNRARGYVFSTASPAANAAVALAALNIMRNEPERREALLKMAAHVRHSLQQQGWRIGNSESQIVPLILGEPSPALRLSETLRGHKIWIPCIRPPSVPPGQSLLRISLSSAHTESMVDVLLDTLFAHRPR